MLINKKDKPTILAGLAIVGVPAIEGGRMGKKVERDILAALGTIGTPDITQIQSDITGLQALSEKQEIFGWTYATMADARGSNGTAMGLFTGDGSGLTSQWKAARNGTIVRLSGMLGTKITAQAMRFGVNRNGVDFYGGVAVTVGSGQSCASVATALTIFAGDVITMMFAGGESLAPFSATPFSASFEVKYA